VRLLGYLKEKSFNGFVHRTAHRMIIVGISL